VRTGSDGPASVTALGLFLVSLPIWIYAFGLAIVVPPAATT